MDCGPPGSSVHGDSPGKNLEWAAMPSSRGSSYPGIKPKSPVFPALQVDSLPPVPPGKTIMFLRMIFSIPVTELQNDALIL